MSYCNFNFANAEKNIV